MYIKRFVHKSTEDDRSSCRNMSYKLKSFVVLTHLLISRSFGNIIEMMYMKGT